MNFFKFLYSILFILFAGDILADTVPAKPTLSILQNWTEGGYDVQWTKWSGSDGAQWALMENGHIVYTGNLPPSTDGHQSGTYAVRNPNYGVYQYQVILTNQIGESRSDSKAYAVEGASLIISDKLDQGSQAIQVTLEQNKPFDIPLAVAGSNSSQFTFSTNHQGIFSYQLISPNIVRLTGLQAGRSSLRIKDTVTGNERYLGVRVREANGNLPGMPPYIAMGSVSEDTASDLNFWKNFTNDETNRRVEIRYIYINGGPKNQGGGWRTWTSRDGFRVTSYVRESLKLGMIPFLVYYNIPDGGESYYTNKQHLLDPIYMAGYFTDLKFALDLARAEAKDEMVGIILEPDSLGYFSQNNEKSSQVVSKTSSAYSTGVLDAAIDPIFPDTLTGTVKAINYTIRKYLPQAYFGWQFNLWASPAGGYTTAIPGTGIVHLTDTKGIEEGRLAIKREAVAIADYYIDAGVLSYGANFVSIDKYGLDAGAEGKSNNPATSTWFWNAIHWTNYLEFVKMLSVKTKLPVILWQIPVGHINQSLAINPYSSSQQFPTLINTSQHFEDSAPVYFLGDRFITEGNRLAFFKIDDTLSKVAISGNTVVWDSHMDLARKAGVQAILFGAGVGDSTHGTGSPPSDQYWWITKVQHYLKNPMPVCSVFGDCPTDADLPAPDDDAGGGGGNDSSNITHFPAYLSYQQSKDTGWGSGAQFSCLLKNQGTKTVSHLKIQFLVPPSKISLWNVAVIASSSQSVTISLPSWKESLAPGEVYSFGFVIQPEVEPSVAFISASEE